MLPRTIIRLAAVLALAATPPVQSTNESLQNDLELLLSWFPGRYDSAEQVLLQEQSNVPEDQRNYRRHSIFRAVTLPAFGDHVLYAEQYRDGDPDKIYRQRIYVFTADPEEDAIRLRIHIPKEPQTLKGAYRQPELLDHLQPGDTITWDGCDVFWKREQPDRFRGELKRGACRFNSKRFNQQVLLNEYLIMTPTELWFADHGESLDGQYLFGMKGDTPAKSVKIRPFECQMSGEKKLLKVWLHDQGGEATVDQAGDRSRSIRLVLRRIRSSDAAGLPAMNLYVYQGGGAEVNVSTVGYDDRHISVNFSTTSISCAYAPERMYQDGRG